MIDLKGRTALVTGGTMGVGHSIAKSLAEAGANVVLHGLVDDLAARQSVEEVQNVGADCQLVTADLAGPTEAAVAELFDAAISVCERSTFSSVTPARTKSLIFWRLITRHLNGRCGLMSRNQSLKNQALGTCRRY